MDIRADGAGRPRDNLPAELNSFVGREQELGEIEHLLGTTRLLTLVGTGGVGKTRLAQRVASQVLDRYPDGAWLIELAAVVESTLLPYAAAMSLGLRELPGLSPLAILTQHLQPKRLLLVLDNCEHLVASSAHLIDTLLRACPGLRVLATSREPLGIAGEITWRVPSLSLPWPPPPPPREPGAQSEAVRLFLERASEAAPTFALTEDNKASIARVCYRLDGIPLALELAATRVTALGVEQIADELDDRFRLLVGGKRTAVPHQQTLQATFDWSFNLLTDPERAVLRRLAPFAGGFGLDAARAVCSGSDVAAEDVLEHLTRLVNKSLVSADVRAQTARFHLLETVQQYAAARLQEAGETLAAGAQHLSWFLDLAEGAEPEQRSADQALWLDRLEMEHENLTAALEWSRTAADGAEAGLRLAASLRWFWFARGHPSEGLLWLKRGLANVSGVAPRVRAKGLDAAGALCHSLGDLVSAEAYLTEGLTIWRQMGDKRGMTISLNTLGLVAKAQGSLVRAGTQLSKALALAREMNDAPTVATVLNNLAALAIDQGDYGAAQPFLRESLSIKRGLGDAAGIANSLHNLGNAAVHQGTYDQAAAALQRTELTPREREVARLVALGLTNRGIAHELGIATATATLHVEHIRGKLGFHSRAQIATWVSLSS